MNSTPLNTEEILCLPKPNSAIRQQLTTIKIFFFSSLPYKRGRKKSNLTFEPEIVHVILFVCHRNAPLVYTSKGELTYLCQKYSLSCLFLFISRALLCFVSLTCSSFSKYWESCYFIRNHQCISWSREGRWINEWRFWNKSYSRNCKKNVCLLKMFMKVSCKFEYLSRDKILVCTVCCL